MRQAIFFLLLSQFLLPDAQGDRDMGDREMGDPQMGDPHTGYPQRGYPQMINSQMGNPKTINRQMGNPKMQGRAMAPSNDPTDQTEDAEELNYKSLSPGAFFGMKENENAPVGWGMGSNPGMGPAMGPAMGPMGIGKNEPLGYEHFDLTTLNAMSRQQQKLQENFALIATIKDDQNKTDELIIYNLCFSLSYIFRRGRQSIRKYFNLRDIYSNHLAYEIGYIVHVISVRYQNMLELYQYSSSLVGEGNKVKINRIHMTHFQYSISEDSRTIVHLCNMLHELQRKYESKPYDPTNKFEIPYNSTYTQATTQGNDPDEKIEGHNGREGKMPKIDKAYLAKRIELSHKLINEALAKRKKKLQQAKEFYQKHGHMPSSKRTQQPMRLWSPNLDYGWSVEEDW